MELLHSISSALGCNDPRKDIDKDVEEPRDSDAARHGGVSSGVAGEGEGGSGAQTPPRELTVEEEEDRLLMGWYKESLGLRTDNVETQALFRKRLDEEALERIMTGQLTEEERKEEEERERVRVWDARTGITKYPYESAGEDELSFEAGAQLKVLKNDGVGWLRCADADGNEGRVGETFLEMDGKAPEGFRPAMAKSEHTASGEDQLSFRVRASTLVCVAVV